jgi:hypothetical protein
MNGHAEPIAGNTPLTSRIRTRVERGASTGVTNNKSGSTSRLRFQVRSTSSTDDNEDNDEAMQQRQFTRVPDGVELDELEGGQGNPSLLNGNSADKTRFISEKERFKAKQDDPLLSNGSSNKDHVDNNEMIASTSTGGLTEKDKKAMVLLVALYLLQGIPVGLAFGSIPYLLRSKLSYSQIGVFTLCTYPYSLKLLWSPIVDSIFSPKLGRRKSWIVPIQTIVGLMLWWLSRNINQYIDKVGSSRDICHISIWKAY